MMSKPRLTVALVTETYPPEINGVAMTLARLVDGCRTRGHLIHLVRPRQQHEQCIDRESSDDLLTPGLPLPRYPDLRFGLPVWRRLEEAWRKQLPDVVHIATEGPLGLAALWVAKRMGIPVLSTFHTNFHTYSRHYGFGLLYGSIDRYLRWFHNSTEQTLVPTRAMATDLQNRGFRGVDVLSRGVDARLFHPSRRCTALRAQWGASEDTPVCLVVSRIAPEKNIALTLKAYASIRQARPDARMVCVGSGPLLAQLTREHPDCHFAGTRVGEDLAAHYASADLFLFASITETFGNVISEALASGVPVIAFAKAAAAELVIPGRNGWLAKPGDEAEFLALATRAGHQLVHDEDSRDAVSRSIRHLDWETIHQRYEDCLIDAIRSWQMSQVTQGRIGCVPD